MKRIVIAVALVVAAAVIFIVGRSLGAEPLRVSSTGARYAVTVVIDEPTTGRVSVEVLVTSGEPDSVAVSTVMPGMGHSTPEVIARQAGPGRFVAEGELFPMSGAWEVPIRLDGPAGEEVLVVDALITG
ncbi:YtkA-like protein [Nonomuraea polychroma]|uniref:YtkA-like protein n=1 Tax=Nonomuraea polychroma TaxID=46176 RepID=A0A438M7D3_9ACTN|nr:FixH family protein [Nonomuraea polychroma]RVX41629.1 YtkA-like protein [Nonomuraea polychroma]